MDGSNGMEMEMAAPRGYSTSWTIVSISGPEKALEVEERYIPPPQGSSSQGEFIYSGFFNQWDGTYEICVHNQVFVVVPESERQEHTQTRMGRFSPK